MFSHRKYSDVKARIFNALSSADNRKVRKKICRRINRSKQLCFEALEDRTMLSAVGLMQRTDGHVNSNGGVVVHAGGVSGAHGGMYDPGDLGQTTASVSDSNSISNDGGSASGDMKAAASHGAPIGATTSIAYAAVGTSVAGNGSDDAGTNSSAAATSDGNYTVVDVPANAIFHGHWLVEIAPNTSGVAGYSSAVHLKITTRTNEWYVDAQLSSDGGGMVTYNLPIEGFASFPVSGGVYLPFDETFAYDGSTSIQIESNVATLGGGMVSDPGASYSFDVQSVGEAYIFLEDVNVGAALIPGGLPTPPIPKLAPPKVANVAVASTAASLPFYSFAAAGNVGSQEQLRSVPVGGANQISVKFTKNVVISASDLRLTMVNRVVSPLDGDYNRNGTVDASDYTIWRDTLGSNSDLRADGNHNGTIDSADYTVWTASFGAVAQSGFAGAPDLKTFVAPDNTNGHTATWTFVTPLLAAQYLLWLPDSIHDFDGNALDGEWSNPGSINSNVTTTVFASGDNSPGGDFKFIFTYLPGDANRDNQVNSADNTVVLANLNTGGIKAWAQGDFTGDGTVSGNDYALLLTYFNKADWRDLLIVGDYNHDFKLGPSDQTTFESFYSSNDSRADLNADGVVNQADHDAFFTLLGDVGTDLRVVF
jgi:Dockerin type I domain